MRTTASVDSWIVGSGTLSTRTSRLPCQVSAFNSSPSLALPVPIVSIPTCLPGTSSPKLVHLHKPALISSLFTGVRGRQILGNSYSTTCMDRPLERVRGSFRRLTQSVQHHILCTA